MVGDEFDVELELPKTYKVTKEVINSINHIPGVVQVERFKKGIPISINGNVSSKT